MDWYEMNSTDKKYLVDSGLEPATCRTTQAGTDWALNQVNIKLTSTFNFGLINVQIYFSLIYFGMNVKGPAVFLALFCMNSTEGTKAESPVSWSPYCVRNNENQMTLNNDLLKNGWFYKFCLVPSRSLVPRTSSFGFVVVMQRMKLNSMFQPREKYPSQLHAVVVRDEGAYGSQRLKKTVFNQWRRVLFCHLIICTYNAVYFLFRALLTEKRRNKTFR